MHRRNPMEYLLLNELADVAAGTASDHQGLWKNELVEADANEKLLW